MISGPDQKTRLAAPSTRCHRWTLRLPICPRRLVATIEKTADYTIRNGEAFESLIREKQRHNPTFSFLFETSSPAHAFYQQKLALALHSLAASRKLKTMPKSRTQYLTF